MNECAARFVEIAADARRATVEVLSDGVDPGLVPGVVDRILRAEPVVGWVRALIPQVGNVDRASRSDI